ncbi:MAG: hypothetical protein SGI97_09480 [candidate division Zixibacteria bacterium]|nr:hypothetical protein [candidate division Zixibacteria bacterium]
MSVIIGSLGVGLVLLAFVLNLLNRLSESSSMYLFLNVVGSAMAGWYAWESKTIPLVVLEVAWGLAALVKLFVVIKASRRSRIAA